MGLYMHVLKLKVIDMTASIACYTNNHTLWECQNKFWCTLKTKLLTVSYCTMGSEVLWLAIDWRRQKKIMPGKTVESFTYA